METKLDKFVGEAGHGEFEG
jgi:hypothetical protein